MKLLSLLIALLFTLPARAEEEEEVKPATIEASAVYRTTLSAAKSLVVLEGLPHQKFEQESFLTESARKDTQKIWIYPFYTPSVEAKNATDLRKLLGNSATIKVYGGYKKLCGGFHPDYSLSWQAGETTYYALLCFGCGEILFYDGKAFLLYDLDKEALDHFKELLAVHKAKRPEKVKNTSK